MQRLQRLRRFPRSDRFYKLELGEKADVDFVVRSRWKLNVGLATGRVRATAPTGLADFSWLLVEERRE